MAGSRLITGDRRKGIKRMLDHQVLCFLSIFALVLSASGLHKDLHCLYYHGTVCGTVFTAEPRGTDDPDKDRRSVCGAQSFLTQALFSSATFKGPGIGRLAKPQINTSSKTRQSGVVPQQGHTAERDGRAAGPDVFCFTGLCVRLAALLLLYLCRPVMGSALRQTGGTRSGKSKGPELHPPSHAALRSAAASAGMLDYEPQLMWFGKPCEAFSPQTLSPTGWLRSNGEYSSL
ncbi:hypothetical protein EYF80_013521 [Liparis tanakae]|uniref:Uncharacterized protein n=1 Tax=Liparis tanakae TaxID=230148 RepID=A0A4Z2IGH0_9TELE|nr:hypothetical protein EYF80_013521 [Liparis tanakae]